MILDGSRLRADQKPLGKASYLAFLVGYFFGLVCVGFNFKSGLPATINSKIQARVTDCNINFKVFFLTAVPATKWLKKTGWASQFATPRKHSTGRGVHQGLPARCTMPSLLPPVPQTVPSDGRLMGAPPLPHPL